MVVLVHPVFDCLMRLAKPDALVNEEEVRCVFYSVIIVENSNHMTHESMGVILAHFEALILTGMVFLCRWIVWCCSCIASESSWRRQTASGWTSCSSSYGTASCCRRASPPWPVCCCWRSWSSEPEAGC